MSEHEKFEQVGRLAEEVNRLKGELAHLNEKTTRAFSIYQRMSQTQPQLWTASGGQLQIPQTSTGMKNTDFDALLNKHELIQVLEHREKLKKELASATERLHGLAPHLFQNV